MVPSSELRPTTTPRAGRRGAAALALAVALVAAACGGGDDGSSAAPTSTAAPTTTAVGGPADAAFAGPGPYEVGVTELQLPDRSVTVWYPAAEGSTDGAPDATYSQLEALPPALAEAAPALLPAGTDPSVLEVTMEGVAADVPASEDGPFPVALFSHGFGSFRKDASGLAAGMASWGFVVAAPQHLERDRAALVSGNVVRDPARDVAVLVDTVGLVGAAGGVLEGLADTDRVGAVGHSAGGRAVLSALSEEPIDVAVGWAAAGRADVPAPDKPSMNIAARVDVLVPLEEVEATHAGLAAPKRLVVIEGAGHNSFTDLCPAVQAGTDLFGLAQQVGLQIPENLVAGGRDGCEAGAIPTDEAWAITQHFTVAQLRAALGVDEEPVGLAPAVAAGFGDAVEYRVED